MNRFRRITSGGNFIPEIDGLRFLAIGGVLLFHSWFNTRVAYGLPTPREGGLTTNFFNRGALGVELFFALSGFILALPFARNLIYGAKTVDISRYYLRRVTRIEPPYIVALVGVYLAAWGCNQVVKFGLWPTFSARVFYLYGLIWRDAPTLNGVTWSLELEVQFYLLMPVFAQIFRMPALPRRTLMLLVVIVFPFIEWKGLLLYSVFSQLGLFFAGILFADLYLEQERTGFAKAGWNDFAAIVLLTLVFSIPVTINGVRQYAPVAILLFFLLLFNGVWLRRLLSWKPVYLIGGMCYSIYLIHQPIISTFCRWLAHKEPMLSDLGARSLVILLWIPAVLCISALFFAVIEHPCMDPGWPRKLWTRILRGKSEAHVQGQPENKG